MELSGCKALLLAALIVASSRLLHGPPACCSAAVPELPPEVGGEGGAANAQQQPAHAAGALPFLGRGVRACFPAGALGRFHQAMLVVLLARGGGRMAVGRWRSTRRRG